MMKRSRNFLLLATVAVLLKLGAAQQSGSFNFAKKTAGEREGDLSPSAIAGVSIACVGALVGLTVTIFFCYYVHRQVMEQDSFNNSFDPARRI